MEESKSRIILLFSFQGYKFRLVKIEEENREDFYGVLVTGKEGCEQLDAQATNNYVVFYHPGTKTIYIYEIKANAVAMTLVQSPSESEGVTFRLEETLGGLHIISVLGEKDGRPKERRYYYDSGKNEIRRQPEEGKKKKGAKF